jgi:4-amino-4-deoxy-L-arabinose transferase-like glycosyltransferase
MNSTLAPPHRIAWPPKRAARTAGQTLAAERSEPSWARPALIALLLCTALAYMIDLSASGYANSFYAAAVQAGTKSWKAFFFGSIDSSNFITVDKPPASLWVMAISGRIFGFSSWSMLVPQALEGVAAVALLHASVKRWFGAGAGLAAGALFALTPVAALMFRFNNPDALLVCLLVAGAYCLTRAIEGASTRWVVAAGTMIGLAFLAKMMQAFLVLPAFALVYMVAAPTGLRRRLTQVLAGAAAIVVSAGWWVAIVALWPASSRPFIDGSPDNSILNLITGYNGLGRIFGASGPGGGGGANFSGSTGVLRLFNTLMGGQASWLLPAALLAVVAGIWSTRRAPPTDRTRAALMLWGGWLVVSGLVFSLGSGVIHTYYTVALAPAIAAPIAIMGSRLWKKRHEAGPRTLAAVTVLLTTGWSWVLLDRTPNWESWLLVLIPLSALSALIALVGLLAAPALRRLGGGAAAATAAFALVACLAGPVAYSAETISTAHTGSIPSAGPATSGAGGGPGGAPGGASVRTASRSGTVAKLSTGAGKPAGAGLAGGGGGATGGGTQSVSSALKKALEADSGSYRWVAAVSGSQSAASLELATGGAPVMAIGGFNNEGGNLSLAQFKRYVAKGEIHYYLAGAAQSLFSGGQSGAGTPPGGSALGSGPTGAPGGAPTGARGIPGGGGASSSSSAITAWVKAHYKTVTIGGQTVYDLTQARS